MSFQTKKYPQIKQYNRWSCTLAALSSIAFLATACGDATDKTADDSTPLVQSKEFALLPAPNCDIVRNRLVEATTEQVLNNRYDGYYWGNNMDSAGPPQSNTPEAGADNDSAPDDYTETNVQEAGVDEPDIVKTDGKYIYTTRGNELLILKSWPANETTIVGRHNLGSNGYANSLFLQGDRVALFSNVYDDYNYGYDYEGQTDETGVPTEPADEEKPTRPENYRHFYGTRITILDVTDRTAPKVEKRLDIEGWMNSARMIDGKVYLVSNSYMNSPINIWEWINDKSSGLPDASWTQDADLREQRKNQARPLVKARIAQEFAKIDIKELMPRARTTDAAGKTLSTAPIYECSDLYLPQQVTDLGLLNISSFDLNAPANIESTGLLANGWTVYSSQQNLYIAMSSQSWWWGRSNSKNESHIHKFALSKGAAKPAYMASGKVDGWLLNQFSMSEYDGHLRVATTDNQWDWNPNNGGTRVDKGGNNIIILKQNNNVLEETGAVRGLAPGEQIYAVRMIADKGYMVTFFQIDPLYTFDLADHTKPKMLGELKINGYSSYIHPIANNSLLTIGMDADDQGRVKGVHLQIFDVSNMKNPTRSHQHLISTGGWSSHSEALYNHHAFTYDAKREILAVPVNIYENNTYFTGLILFKANAKDGIQEIGRVSHGDLVAKDYCLRYNNTESCQPDQYWHWYSNMRRSIFMGGDNQDYVYSLSDVGLKVNDLYTPTNQHAAVLFRN